MPIHFAYCWELGITDSINTRQQTALDLAWSKAWGNYQRELSLGIQVVCRSCLRIRRHKNTLLKLGREQYECINQMAGDCKHVIVPSWNIF